MLKRDSTTSQILSTEIERHAWIMISNPKMGWITG